MIVSQKNDSIITVIDLFPTGLYANRELSEGGPQRYWINSLGCREGPAETLYIWVQNSLLHPGLSNLKV